MSNERIDLTQFEGMEEWEVEKRPDGGYAIKTGRDNFSLEEAETIAKLPTLIAELKRCYEREDVAEKALLENAEMMRKYVGQITETNRKIRDTIDACNGVDSLFGEEVIGMLQELLA